MIDLTVTVHIPILLCREAGNIRGCSIIHQNPICRPFPTPCSSYTNRRSLRFDAIAEGRKQSTIVMVVIVAAAVKVIKAATKASTMMMIIVILVIIIMEIVLGGGCTRRQSRRSIP